jgi:uncharacterized protein (DUF433 family)
MVVAAHQQLVGTGLYTVQEAALYARIPAQTLTRWMFGSQQGAAVVRPEFNGERFVTFTDFIQALAVRAIRITWKLPLQKIRDAVKRAEDEYHIEYPLARQRVIYLFNGEIYIRPNPEDSLVQVSGRTPNQQAFKHLVEPYIHDISFDPATGLAVRYEAFRYDDERIEMDPNQHLGEPFFSTSGYSPRVLWEAVQSEGSVPGAARAYGVEEKQVEVAFRYLDHLELRSAA